MSETVLLCARLFEGLSDSLPGPTEIQRENGVSADIAHAAGRSAWATVSDLGDRTVMPAFIATQDHLCLDYTGTRHVMLFSPDGKFASPWCR
jgi:hypothetical protein